MNNDQFQPLFRDLRENVKFNLVGAKEFSFKKLDEHKAILVSSKDLKYVGEVGTCRQIGALAAVEPNPDYLQYGNGIHFPGCKFERLLSPNGLNWYNLNVPEERAKYFEISNAIARQKREAK